MRRTLKRVILAPAAVVLLLACSGSYACGQGGTDGFFNAGGVTRDGDVSCGTSWDPYGSGGFNGWSWDSYGSDDPSADAGWEPYTEGSLPVGSGLLVLAASGACYAALRGRRRRDRAAD